MTPITMPVIAPHRQPETPPSWTCAYQEKINTWLWRCYTQEEYNSMLNAKAERSYQISIQRNEYWKSDLWNIQYWVNMTIIIVVTLIWLYIWSWDWFWEAFVTWFVFFLFWILLCLSVNIPFYIISWCCHI